MPAMRKTDATFVSHETFSLCPLPSALPPSGPSAFRLRVLGRQELGGIPAPVRPRGHRRFSKIWSLHRASKPLRCLPYAFCLGALPLARPVSLGPRFGLHATACCPGRPPCCPVLLHAQSPGNFGDYQPTASDIERRDRFHFHRGLQVQYNAGHRQHRGPSSSPAATSSTLS